MRRRLEPLLVLLLLLAPVSALAAQSPAFDLVLRNASDDHIVETTGATPERFSAFAPIADAADQIGRASCRERV